MSAAAGVTSWASVAKAVSRPNDEGQTGIHTQREDVLLRLEEVSPRTERRWEWEWEEEKRHQQLEQ